jgi:2,3-bisphosphoglycerate-independent phosphoglycerate mutase
MVMVAGPGWPRGLGLAAGMEVEDSGAGDGAAASRALAAFDAGADVVFVHADAPWEASMDGDPGRKVEEIERIDSGIIGPLREGLAYRGAHRLVVTVDCAASSTDRCSLSDPVPFVLAGDGVPASRRAPRMTEAAAAAADLEVDVPSEFLPYLLG